MHVAIRHTNGQTIGVSGYGREKNQTSLLRGETPSGSPASMTYLDEHLSPFTD